MSMKKNERLFLALGAAGEDLLQRSEEAGKRRRGLWTGVLAAAACTAIYAVNWRGGKTPLLFTVV